MDDKNNAKRASKNEKPIEMVKKTKNLVEKTVEFSFSIFCKKSEFFFCQKKFSFYFNTFIFNKLNNKSDQSNQKKKLFNVFSLETAYVIKQSNKCTVPLAKINDKSMVPKVGVSCVKSNENDAFSTENSIENTQKLRKKR